MKNSHNSKIKTTQFFKMDKGSEQVFLQRKYVNNQKSHEKMLNVISQQENANQNDSEIPLHSHMNGKNQKYEL